MSKTRRDLKKEKITKEDIKKTSKLERLSKKIVTSFFHIDEEGKVYVNYCSFWNHPGIIGDYLLEKKKCSTNGCHYYKKLIEK